MLSTYISCGLFLIHVVHMCGNNFRGIASFTVRLWQLTTKLRTNKPQVPSRVKLQNNLKNSLNIQLLGFKSRVRNFGRQAYFNVEALLGFFGIWDI